MKNDNENLNQGLSGESRPVAPQAAAPTFKPQPIESQYAPTSGLNIDGGKKILRSPKRPRRFWKVILAICLVTAIAVSSVIAWYFMQIQPVDASNDGRVLITIESGETPNQIANTLEEKGVIRNSTAFLIYARISGTQGSLRSGDYRLSPAESIPEIVNHIVMGEMDTFSITFLPGNTLADNREILIGAGYSSEEVDAALDFEYDLPLFKDKPSTADLEGYIYGDTYNFSTNTDVKDVLIHVFEKFHETIEINNLEQKYAVQGLNLFEGITLASIIQREASVKGDDMPQIAQIFLLRLSIDMQLGSDVTYQYIADKLGLERDPNLDNPYNTRRYSGLPPGPISAPGEKALLAVASPAEGDYLYFLSGDDDITYYGRNLEEHEANIRNHCLLKCQIV